MPLTPRRLALITGATGGMGRAVAQRLGYSMELILTDLDPQTLGDLTGSLRDEGYRVVGAEAGDLSEPVLIDRLCNSVRQSGELGALVHTASLSPAQDGWQCILRVNMLATQRLVIAIERLLGPGAAAVLISSMAGHIDPKMPEADRLLDENLTDELLGKLQPLLFSGRTGEEGERIAAQSAYILSKRAVIRLCERRASAWEKMGARIVSVSPGLIHTPMGMKEAEVNPHLNAAINAQPLPRWGTSMDIAAAVEFPASPSASFITGCDLRIDGGATSLSPGR